MSSTRNAVDVAPAIGYGVGSVLVIGLLSGIVLQQQVIWTVWGPLAAIAVVAYLCYRAARSVTHFAVAS